MAAAPKTFQFKLVLLGDSAVGKSSLVLRFVRGQFFEYQEATIGGEFRCGGVARRAHPTVDVTESARGRRGARWEAYVWAHTLLFAAAFLTQTVALNDTTVKFGDPPAPPLQPPTTHRICSRGVLCVVGGVDIISRAAVASLAGRSCNEIPIS